MINKDANFWNNNFNLLGPVYAFSAEFKLRLNIRLLGLVYVVVYERKNGKIIKKKLDESMFLEGFLPYKNNNKSDYDLMITPEKVIDKLKLIPLLKDVADLCNVIEIELKPSPKDFESTQVAILELY